MTSIYLTAKMRRGKCREDQGRGTKVRRRRRNPKNPRRRRRRNTRAVMNSYACDCLHANIKAILMLPTFLKLLYIIYILIVSLSLTLSFFILSFFIFLKKYKKKKIFHLCLLLTVLRVTVAVGAKHIYIVRINETIWVYETDWPEKFPSFDQQ